MPSPFPGMDPYIESQKWQDFHSRFINDLADLLTPKVRPRYVVEIEQYVYLARDDELPDRVIEPDLTLVEGELGTKFGSAAAIATLAPSIYTLPVPRQHRQRFLTIRNRQFRNVVTVIELLSPTNKKPGDGTGEYLAKRSNILYTGANLVEIDLLRCGARLATKEPLAPADYYAFVCRASHTSKAEVYRWTLRDRLPVLPIPLADGDPDVPLDLQVAFTTTYDRTGYDYALDYRQPVDAPLDETTADWARALVGR